MFTRSMTLLNGTGDTTIAWTEEADEKMLAAIQKKLDAGYTFFITKNNDPEWMKRVKSADEIKNREVLLLDDDLHDLFMGKEFGVIQQPSTQSETTRVSRDANEIAKSQSVATRPLRGG